MSPDSVLIAPATAVPAIVEPAAAQRRMSSRRNEPSSHDVGGEFCSDLVKYDTGAALATAADCCETYGIDPTAAMPKAIECDRALGYNHEVLETLEHAQKKAHDKDARESAE